MCNFPWAKQANLPSGWDNGGSPGALKDPTRNGERCNIGNWNLEYFVSNRDALYNREGGNKTISSFRVQNLTRGPR